MYDSQGTVLATATVDSSDPTDADGVFHFHGITPVSLAASTTYYIAADVIVGQMGEYLVTGLTTDPAIHFGVGVESFGLGNNPTSDIQGGSNNPGYFGPSFEIQPSAVPEPSGFVLIGIGIGAGALASSKRRRS